MLPVLGKVWRQWVELLDMSGLPVAKVVCNKGRFRQTYIVGLCDHPPRPTLGSVCVARIQAISDEETLAQVAQQLVRIQSLDELALPENAEAH
jgi:hypothetical protein